MPANLTPLSRHQIRLLCTLAGKAFKESRARHAIDDTLDLETFRKNGQVEACGIMSLKDCHQGHFLALRGKWFVVLGRLEEAFNDFLNAGDAPQRLRQMRWRFIGQVAALAEAIGSKHERETGITLDLPHRAERAKAYAEAISKDQFRSPLNALDAQQLERLGFTVTNRTNALSERGDPKNRNKSQRHENSASEFAEETLISKAARRLGHSAPVKDSWSNRL